MQKLDLNSVTIQTNKKRAFQFKSGCLVLEMYEFDLEWNSKVKLPLRQDLPDCEPQSERRALAPWGQAAPATSLVAERLCAAARQRRRTRLRPGCSSTPEPAEELQH